MFRPHGVIFQAYKMWCRTRYVCNYYLRDPVVYSALVITIWYVKLLLKYK